MSLWDKVSKYAHGILTDADELWHTDVVPFLQNLLHNIKAEEVKQIDPIVKATVSSLEDAVISAAKTGSVHGLVNTIGGIALEAAREVEGTVVKTGVSAALATVAQTLAVVANHPAVVDALAAEKQAAEEAAAQPVGSGEATADHSGS